MNAKSRFDLLSDHEEGFTHMVMEQKAASFAPYKGGKPSENEMFGLNAIEISNPPSPLLKAIIDAMRHESWRDLPISYVPNALQMLTMAAGKRKGFGGVGLDLFTIVLAKTAAGKENGQDLVKRLMVKLGRPAFGAPRSEASLVEDVVKNEGYAYYVMDEIQGFYEGVNASNRPAYLTGAGDKMMEMLTSGLLPVASTHKKRFEKDLADELEDLKSKLEDKFLLAELREIYKARALSVENSLVQIAKGYVASPKVCIAGASTPAKMDKVATLENLQSGFLGRALIFRAPDHATPAKLESGRIGDDGENWLAGQLRLIKDMEHQPVGISEAGWETFKAMHHYIEHSSGLIHTAPLDGLYRRAVERIKVVASICALDTGVVTPEHLCYAMKLVFMSIEDCGYMHGQNFGGDDEEESIQKIQARVEKALETRNYVSKSEIEKELKKVKWYKELFSSLGVFHKPEMKDKTPLDLALVAMEVGGKVVLEPAENKGTRIVKVKK